MTASFAKRATFSLIAVLLFLAAVTLALFLLEKEKVISTERADDRVNYEGQNGVVDSWGDYLRVGFYGGQSRGMDALEKKEPGVFRIYIVGGSFAMGTPYMHTVDYPENICGGIPGWLLSILKARLPTLKLQVVNAAQSGANSFRVREIVQRIAGLRPDLVIVISGNNEGVVPATRFNQPLHKWILYRALKKTVKPEPEKRLAPFYPPQDPDTEKIRAGFSENIPAMLSTIRNAKSKAALCTLPVNMKFLGPVPKKHGGTPVLPKDDPHFQSGLALMEKDEYEKAVAAFAKCPQLEFAAYYLGLCFEKLGEFEKAKEFYSAYVENLPLGRMRPSFNGILRKQADEFGIPLIDLEAKMEQISEHRIPDEKWFVDNCHLTWQGYFEMFKAIVDGLIESGALPGSGKREDLPEMEELVAKSHCESLYRMKPVIWTEELDRAMEPAQ